MASRSTAAALAVAAAATALVVAMVAYPEVAFQAAVRGLKLWWDEVFPALLPFFIGGQVLMGLGVVHFVGVLLEPFMRPLFNLPGVGGFVTAMGLASGYPIGALLTARLRRDRLITAVEGERLMSFANTADPLFMAGAVAVGMFGQPEVAGVLVAAHYIGAVLTGFALRFYRPWDPPSPPPAAQLQGSMIRRAVQALVEARRQDGRPLGQLLGDCVRDSVQTLLLIGGFIILFSTLLDIAQMAGLTRALAAALAAGLRPLGLDPATGPALVAGFFEITLGTQLSAQAPAPLLDRLVAASAVIGWAGLSVHGQVAAIIQGTGMRLAPYIAARLLHAVAAGAVTVWLLREGVPEALLRLGPAWAASAAAAAASPAARAWESLERLVLAVGAVLALALLAEGARRLVGAGWRAAAARGGRP